MDNDSQDMEDLLKWAYAEADLFLITEWLIGAGGASTIGDCVDALEQWDLLYKCNNVQYK